MRWLFAAPLLLVAGHAAAEDRDYCPERPGLDTPACTMAPGHISVETSLADWTLDKQPDSRTDTVLIGDTIVRIGVTGTIEARIGWTPFGHVRERDRATGAVAKANRIGDVTLGAKVNLANPDGSGLSVSVLPYVSLPVGRMPVGAGDWSTGVLLPVTYEVSDAVQLEATPEVDAAVDEDGDGQHLAYSLAGGVGWTLSKALTLTGELQALRDDDPSGHTTQALAALSLAVSASDDLQFDVQGNAGLSHEAPDVELIAGVARRF